MEKETKKILTSIIFHNLRILNKITPQDTYILNYKNHYKKWGDDFFDLYHLAFWWGRNYNPKKIMEIGSRTGLSLVQLLSGCLDYTDMKIVLFDRWDDGLSNPELIKKHLEYLALPTDCIEFHQGDSAETVPEYKKNNPNEKFDWILVDGSHQEPCVTTDFNNVIDMVKTGGVIVADDINCQPEDNIDVKKAWNNFKNNNFDHFIWREDLNGKGIGFAIKR